MKDFTKNFIKTALTLLIIAGGSTLLVGAVNAVTAPVIAENNVRKQNKSLAEVFGDTDVKNTYAERTLDDDTKKDIKYVTKVWDVYSDKDKKDFVGTICRCYGKNGYGDVDFLIGFKGKDYSLTKLVMISDTMSYKGKLEPGYVDPYNAADDGAGKETALQNVKCGATFAASLIRDAVTEAGKVAKGQSTAFVMAPGGKLFGADQEYTEIEVPADLANQSVFNGNGTSNVEHIWRCTKGFVFYSTFDYLDNDFGESFTETLYIGVTTDGKLAGVYLVEDDNSIPSGASMQPYVDAINNATDKDAAYVDDSNLVKIDEFGTGATTAHSCTAIQTLIQQALDAVKSNKVTASSVVTTGFTSVAEAKNPSFTYSFASERR